MLLKPPTLWVPPGESTLCVRNVWCPGSSYYLALCHALVRYPKGGYLTVDKHVGSLINLYEHRRNWVFP